jgi:hypothetical protein
MPQRVRRRRLLIPLAVAGALLAAVMSPGGYDSAGSGSTAPREAAATRLALPDALTRSDLGGSRADAFDARSWAPPPPPPAAPPPQAQVQPEPSPNPYRIAGTTAQDGAVRIYLTNGQRIYEAVPGQMLDDDYRIKSASREGVVLLHVLLGVERRIEADPK